MTTQPARARSLLDMAEQGDMSSTAARIHHAHSLGPVRVELNELCVGRTFLERWPVRHIHPENDWRRNHYISNAPATFILRDAIVHSSAGLIRIHNEIVAETIVFSNPAVNFYAEQPDGLVLYPSRVASMPGVHVTTLYGLAQNYYHALVDGVARLSMIPRLCSRPPALFCMQAHACKHSRLNIAPLRHHPAEQLFRPTRPSMWKPWSFP